MAKKLTIGVDIRDLQLAKTGTKTYLEEICKAFKKLEGETLHFCFLDSSIPVYRGNSKPMKMAEHAKYLLWKQVALPVKALINKCDILFCTDNVVPLIHLGYKTIPVFHDAFFFENPEHYGKLWLWLYLHTAVPAAKRSPFVVTPTAYARQQINHYTGIANHKLAVVYEGPKQINYAPNISPVATGSVLPAQGTYLLHVGTMFKRKNIPSLINAFAQIKLNGDYPYLKLVLAGSTSPASVESDHAAILAVIEKHNLQNEVIFTGYLTDDALALVYQNALMYVFPSVNEGFGIPVLEAFQYDLPALVANNSCLPEVGGDAVLTFDPYNVNDISLKIKTVLDDPQLRQQMIVKGRERLKLFSWEKAALQLVEIFRKAVNYS